MLRRSWVLAWLIAWLFSSLALAAPPEDDWGAADDGGEWVEEPAAGDDSAWAEEAGVEDPNAYDPNAEDPNAYDPNAEDPNAYDPNAVDPNAADPNVAVPEDPNWTGDAELAGEEPVYYEPGAELSDEELAALTAALEQQLGDSEAVEQLAKSGYVICDPSAERDEQIACIKANLAIAKQQVRTTTLAKIEERDTDRLANIAIIVFLAGFAGLLLLATPLVLRKRFPDQGRRLFGFSVLATALFMLNMFLFATGLFILRVVQSVGSQEINPKLAMVDASFEVLDEQAGELVELFPVLFEPTIVQLTEGSTTDMTVLLLQNIAKIQEDVQVFERFAGVFKTVNSVMEYSDIAFSLIAVTVFAIGFKDVFLDIIKLPLRAVQAPGERAGRTIAKSSLARSLREMLVVLVMIFVILILTAIAGATMRLAVGPAIEALLAFVVLGIFHVQLTPDASTFAIGLGLASVATILLLNIAVVMVSNVLFLSRAQKLIRARMQWKVKLRSNWKFFAFGLAIVVGVQLLPWIYLEIANVVFDGTLGQLVDGEQPPLGFVLGFGGVCLLGFWLVAFWAARGLAGIRYLLRYPMPKPPAGAANVGDVAVVAAADAVIDGSH